MFEAFLGSVPGPYHVKSHLPNQDAVLFHEEEGIVFGAVADGAGSLKHSHEGAYLAASSALYAMVNSRKNLDLRKLVEYGLEVARDAVMKLEDYKLYGSTLTLAVLKSDGTAAGASVGDSFAVFHGADGAHELLTGTPLGEYANITELITSDEVNPRFLVAEDVKGFSLSSDGLEQVAILDGQAHSGFWDGIVEKAAEGRLDVDKLFRWLDSLDRIVDDTTLLTLIER